MFLCPWSLSEKRLLLIFSENFKFLEMFYGNGIYDKLTSSSGEHEMLLLAKSQFLKYPKIIMNLCQMTKLALLLMIKRIFVNVPWSRLTVVRNLLKILWQNSGLHVVLICYTSDRQNVVTHKPSDKDGSCAVSDRSDGCTAWWEHGLEWKLHWHSGSASY